MTYAAKVLVIEDEPEIRTILEKALRHAGGFDVVTARSGAEGLDIARHERPALILLDAVMPELDGYETCRRIKSIPELSETPVVFLTASTEPRDVRAAEEAGAAACLGKPFDPLALGEKIAAIIEGERDP